MALDLERCRLHLRRANFRALFIEELGWDRPGASLSATVDDQTFALTAVAQKRGMSAFVCAPSAEGSILHYSLRRKIERQVARSAHEHLIVFMDGGKASQVWQWVKREAGKPAACREHPFSRTQPGDSLLGKLERLAVSLDEEERLTLLDVTGRAKAAFDVEKVTKRFYDRFKTEHQAFLGFIKGIGALADREWYASLMLNRLMFVYFIQKKRFLNGDIDYLRNRLAAMQQRRGRDQFLTFYRYFLLRLFHEGLGNEPQARAADLDELLGKVPYLDGGLFDVHELERAYPTIDIPDEAFERIFDFFDAYQWHLDERPLRADNEINPDVLGYIFEKYINQKQMGAYYTKEDITEYIAKSTIIPFLLEKARDNCLIAFDGDQSVWRLLQADADRYIYEAVRKGIDLPLPDSVAAGVSDVSQRGEWNRPAPAEYALPTEIWREVVARRQRCDELHREMLAGNVRSAERLVTLNLDLRQFAQDVVETAEGPELLRAFWKAVTEVTVLDPTCGSGAFLFAALNVLEPLYEACLERMASFVGDADRSAKAGRPERYPDFRKVLAEVDRHPNRRYFVLKSIIVNNLYGVDIMEEAVEIAKLRLFLKLVAQVETAEHIEPLPDVDFNIRAGNTLVGFTSREDVLRALTTGANGQTRLPFPEDLARVERLEHAARQVEGSFRLFRGLQTELALQLPEKAAVKQQLAAALGELRDELDRYLAGEYGVDATDTVVFVGWRDSHRPFHWFAEFYGIMAAGGFGVTIGNPPYVELNELTEYEPRPREYRCRDCGNLYALLLERSNHLTSCSGFQGFIVPVSSVSTDRYSSLQALLTTRQLHYSSYDDRPSRLFDGLEHIRLTIHLIGHETNSATLASTRYNKWTAVERATLFHRLQYVSVRTALLRGSLAKLSYALEHGIVNKLHSQKKRLSAFYTQTGAHRVCYSRKVGYFLQVLDFAPRVVDSSGVLRPPSEFKEVRFTSRGFAQAALCCLNSSLFYWFVTVVSDCRHVNRREVDSFPVDLVSLNTGSRSRQLADLSGQLMLDLRLHSVEKRMRFKHDTLIVQCIIPKASKPIIDNIDEVLAGYYGLSDEELDFIVNYDIKYRMGRDGLADDED